MNSFYPAATAMLAEICLALLLLSAVLIFSTLRARRHNQTALEQLTEKLKRNEGERLISIKALLKDIYHIPDDQIDAKSATIIKTEMLLYQYLMDTFSSRNAAGLENIDEKITPVIEAYRTLVPQARPDTGSDLETLSSHIERLKERNETLSQQVAALKTEMDETNSEITRVFARNSREDIAAAPSTEETDTVEEIVQEAQDQTDAEQPDKDTAPQADATAEDEHEAVAQGLAKETTPGPAAADKTAAPQTGPQDVTPKATVISADEPTTAKRDSVDENSDDDILKNLDIDLGDTNHDNEDTTGNTAAVPSSAPSDADNSNLLTEPAAASSQGNPPQDNTNITAKVKTA